MLLQTIAQHLQQGGQTLLFLNRRGFAPVLLCHACGWAADCRRCDARLTLHQQPFHLHCHHCGASRTVDRQCPQCHHNALVPVGIGTERLEDALAKYFPQANIARIDRDSTRRKGAMQDILSKIHSGHSQILIGTQMLAKGHHFPEVTLVAILDADSGLLSADFRASERIAQLLIQVAGRAGRAERQGEVVIQTHHPEHPLLLRLIHEGYQSFAQAALAERLAADLPPISYQALIRAEATNKSLPVQFLEQVRAAAFQLNHTDVKILGPIPASMERRAGRYRAQLLLQTKQRPPLQAFLPLLLPQIDALKTARQIRWSLDVDPLEMS